MNTAASFHRDTTLVSPGALVVLSPATLPPDVEQPSDVTQPGEATSAVSTVAPLGQGPLQSLAGWCLRPPTIHLFRRHYQFSKRLFDVAVCLLLLPAALVLIAICAVLIWLNDPGPVFFVQLRTGRGGKRFKMLKLRTMVANAAELRETYAHLNTLTWPDFKIADDPRVTWIGRILRRTSLDELPQIFNVLLGDMSLVGPRPTSFDVSTYALHHTERLEVLPGITGLWQINGRSDLDFDDRLRLDVDYIERRNMWLDVCILFRTFAAVLGRRGAY